MQGIDSFINARELKLVTFSEQYYFLWDWKQLDGVGSGIFTLTLLRVQETKNSIPEKLYCFPKIKP